MTRGSILNLCDGRTTGTGLKKISSNYSHKNQSRSSQVLTGVLLVAILALILWLLYRFPPADFIDNDYLANLVGRYGGLGIAGFYLTGALLTTFGFPRQLVAFSGGYIFGTVTGFLLGIAAAITGCFLCYFLSRRFLQTIVTRRFGNTVDLLNRFVTDRAFLKIVILRLQPFGTNLMTNLSAGISRIPLHVFLGSSLLGYIPQTLVFSLMGSGVRVESSTRLVISTALFGLSVVIGLYLYWTRRPT